MGWKRHRKREDSPRQGFVSCLAEASDEPLDNPGRGWYTVFTFRIGGMVDWEELPWCISADDRLALILLDIGLCREKDLTEEMLDQVRRIFTFFTAHRQQMIVRTVYDTEGKGPEREPSLLSRIQRHMRQLGPVFREFSESICTLQGLLIGSWGEMHGSRYLSEKKLRELAGTLWEATGGTCCLAVRTPWQRRLLAGVCVPEDRIGIFDDGLFGSKTHLGTFGTQADTGVKGEPWLPRLELDYLEQHTGQTPNGGEAVAEAASAGAEPAQKAGEPAQKAGETAQKAGETGTQSDQEPGDTVAQSGPEPGDVAAQVVETLRKMHLTYLNRVYDSRVLDRWKRIPYKDRGSLYDYVGNHLGYRFVLNRVWVEDQTLCIEGRNEGFGRLYRKAGLRLLTATAEGDRQMTAWDELQMTATDLQADPRQWESGGTFTIREKLPDKGSGTLLLFLELRQQDGEVIHFANGSAENRLDRLFLGYLPR